MSNTYHPTTHFHSSHSFFSNQQASPHYLGPDPVSPRIMIFTCKCLDRHSFCLKNGYPIPPRTEELICSYKAVQDILPFYTGSLPSSTTLTITLIISRATLHCIESLQHQLAHPFPKNLDHAVHRNRQHEDPNLTTILPTRQDSHSHWW